MGKAATWADEEGDIDLAAKRLDTLIADAGLNPSTVYQPGEVQRILCISSTTFKRFCDEWEPGEDSNPQGLECFKLSKHRRVPHHALVEWMRRNHAYERDNL